MTIKYNNSINDKGNNENNKNKNKSEGLLFVQGLAV